ncbi:MAG: tetratricopeptide repeat protein, partial [candidate division Zixibacteria bacterium]|nr:tetratricopeptide repeat protein [candidate division Zixibacteria bacterium]
MNSLEYYYHQIRIWLILHKYKVTAGIILAVISILISSFGWLCPRPAELSKQDQEKIDQIPQLEQRTAEIAESVKKLENALGQKPYLDGLTQSPPPVFNPFKKGLDLMAQSKWDEAIVEFKISMKEAKGSQLVALYNLIGICYDTPGKLDSALSSYNKSLELARQFADRMGEANALGNIGNIYYAKGDLDAALKYQQEALKIDREIGYKQGEASDLGNIGLIYKA